jgi:hypothetical protein
MSTPSYKRLGSTPVALTTTLTTNIYNPASGLFAILRALHVVNKTGGAVNFTLYLGLSGGTLAGTELWFQQSVPADSVYDWYGIMEMGSSDYLVGGAGTGTSLTATLMGEEYVQPPTS